MLKETIVNLLALTAVLVEAAPATIPSKDIKNEITSYTTCGRNSHGGRCCVTEDRIICTSIIPTIDSVTATGRRCGRNSHGGRCCVLEDRIECTSAIAKIEDVNIFLSSSGFNSNEISRPRCGRNSHGGRCCVLEDRIECTGAIAIIEDSYIMLEASALESTGRGRPRCGRNSSGGRCCVEEDRIVCTSIITADEDSNLPEITSAAYEEKTDVDNPVTVSNCWRLKDRTCCEMPNRKLRCWFGIATNELDNEISENTTPDAQKNCWRLRDKYCCKMPNGKLRCWNNFGLANAQSGSLSESNANCWRTLYQLCCVVSGGRTKCWEGLIDSEEETSQSIEHYEPGIDGCYYDRVRRKTCCRASNGFVNCGPFVALSTESNGRT